MFAAALGGKREQGDDGLSIDDGARGDRGGDGNFGELHRARIDDDGAIGEGKQSIVSEGSILNGDEKSAGNSADFGGGADRLERCTNRLGSGIYGAADESIGIACG